MYAPPPWANVPELVRLRGLLFEALGEAWGRPVTFDGWREPCAAELTRQLAAGTRKILVIVPDDGDDGGQRGRREPHID